MPNHVTNKLTVTGPAERVRAFVDAARGCHPPSGDEPDSPNYPRELGPFPMWLSFDAIVPLPDEYSLVPYGILRGRSGYDIEVETWGIKWGAYDQTPPVLEDGRATYRFQTAWSPPRVWLRKASEGWPELRFILSYGGEGPVRGRMVAAAGTFEDDRDDDYKRVIMPEYDSSLDEDSDEAYQQRQRVDDRLLTEHDEYVGRWA